MRRIVLPLVLGAAVGAAAVLGVSHRSNLAAPADAHTLESSSVTAPQTVSAGQSHANPAHPAQIAALVALAQRSPDAALGALEALGTGARRAAIDAVARALMRDDPVTALRLVERVRPELRAEFRHALLTQWSLDDPSAVVAWLTSLGSQRDRVALLDIERMWMTTLAAAAPELVFESTATIRGGFGSTLRAAAIHVLAERDSAAAADIALATRDRTERDRYAYVVGRILGEDDPEAAMAWLRSMDEPNWNVVQNTLDGMARTNLESAVDFFLTEPMARSIRIGTFTIAPEGLSSTAASRVAARIAESADPQARSLLQPVLQAWADIDIDAAIDWVVANEQSLTPADQPPIRTSVIPGAPLSSGGSGILASLAGSYAQRDLAAAMRVAASLPPEQRAAWIQSALGAAAFDDPREALRLLEAYRGETFYEATYANLLMRSSATGSPRLIADLLEAAPAAARDVLLPRVAQRWGDVDPAGARDWALAMAPGAERDRVLDTLLGGFARSGEFDQALAAAISNPATRESSLVNAFVALGQVDQETATRQFDAHYEDPALRARIEAGIERTRIRTEQFRRGIGALR